MGFGDRGSRKEGIALDLGLDVSTKGGIGERFWQRQCL